MTNLTFSFDRFIALIQITFDLQLLSSNSERFIPMKFDRSYPTIGKPDRGNSFQLAPTSGAELLAQPRSLPNRQTASDCLLLR
jgi:hypothetical protein